MLRHPHFLCAMNQISRHPTLIFLHIPKTAGSTLQGLLRRYYRGNALYVVDGVKQTVESLIALSDDQKKRIRMIAGHIPYGLHEHLPQSATYFTLLREPVDLVLSYYYYLKEAVTHPYHALVNEPDMTLSKFLELRIDNTVSNVQTRLLAGKVYNGAYKECTLEDLRLAKEHLHESFAVVGLTEAFDETLLLLQRVFGWHNLYYARVNVTRKRPLRAEITPDIDEAICHHNQLDLELYHHAAERFHNRLQQEGEPFRQQVQAFKRRNRQLYPLYYTTWHVERQSKLAYRATLYRLRSLYIRLRNRLAP